MTLEVHCCEECGDPCPPCDDTCQTCLAMSGVELPTEELIALIESSEESVDEYWA